ncbi:MAG: ATP-binding protein [Gammaproteobacteria bacterium]
MKKKKLEITANSFWDSFSEPVLCLNQDFIIQAFNQTFINVFRIKKNAYLQANIDILIENEQHLSFLLIAKNAFQRKQFNQTIKYDKQTQFKLARYNNDYIIVINKYLDEKNKDDHNIFWAQQVREITGQVIEGSISAEECVKRIRYFYEKLLMVIPGNVYWQDKNCRMIGCNQNTLNMLGLKSLEQYRYRTYNEIKNIAGWTEGQAEAFERADQQVLSTGKAIINVEEPALYDENNKPIYYLTNRVPLYDEHQNIIGVLGVSIDITDRKIAEERRLKLEAEKLKREDAELYIERMKKMIGTIAHEFRTPLASIKGLIHGVEYYLPRLIEAYELASANNLPIQKIRENSIMTMKNAMTNIDETISSAFLIIRLLLANIGQDKFDQTNFIELKIREAVNLAISQYPFLSKQKKLVHVSIDHNFDFLGDQKLFDHVLFNLLKNALYYIADANKGQIHISTKETKDENILIFKDTASGIRSDILPRIFEQFFSNTYHGTGLGLSFCKMVMLSFHGDIQCHSEFGKYTEFMLIFPKIK